MLDIHGGTGRSVDFAVERVGAEGRIIGVDPEPQRIQVTQQGGDSRLEFRSGQAQDLSQFADASFDAGHLKLTSIADRTDDSAAQSSLRG